MARPILQFTILFCFLTPQLISAQPGPDILTQIQSTEQSSASRAVKWALDNNAPLLEYLFDDSIVGITGFHQDHPVYFTTHNQRAGATTRTSSLHPGQSTGLNLTGLNFTIGMWDARPAFNGHQEHQSRIIQKETGGVANHATHVAGTLIASGINEEAMGMAPRARIHSYNWNFHSTEMLIEARDGLLISNHSYGRIAGWHKFNLTADSSRWQWFGNPEVSVVEDYLFGYYDQDASLFDHVAYTHPYFLPVVSAGNERDDIGPQSGLYLALDGNNRWREYDVALRPIVADGGTGGFDTLTGIATAKNVLTVGSVVQNNLSDTPALSIFSSAGPTDDGRIKPDLVGVGEHLFSTIATGVTDYASFSGTSMATPNVAGSLVLLQQLATQLYNAPYKAATIKGLAIHTATDIGAIGPDYLTGWGLLNTEYAAQLIQASFRSPLLIQEKQVTNEEVFEIEVLAHDYQDMKITLSWTDPPGAPINATGPELLNNATPTLTHDLNLKVIEQASNDVFLPFVLSRTSPGLNAQTGINSVDPVEQVFIPNAKPGIYTLVIETANDLTTPSQDFSLLLSGVKEPFAPIELDTTHIDVALGEVILSWQTLTENTTGSFVINRAETSRRNADGTQSVYFEQLAILDSRGISTERHSYEYIDPLYLQGEYQYRIFFHPENSEERIIVAEFQVDIPAPTDFEIASIYPNPTSTKSTLLLDVPTDRQVEIAIYNLLGQQVQVIDEKRYMAGRHFIEINAQNLAEGIYFVQLNAREFRLSRSFTILR